MSRLLAVLIAAAVPAAPLAAQQFEGAAVGQQMSYKFMDSTGTGRQSGTLMGVNLGVGFNRFHVMLRGVFGKVSDPEENFVPRDLRHTTITAGLQMSDWMELGLEAQARHESRGDENTLQRMVGPFARTIADFGGTGLQGLAELALYPITSSQNTPDIALAMRAAIGVRYVQLTGPMSFGLSYRFSRFDFKESGGVTPLSQDESFAVEVGLRRR